jgi:hypothetical protein
MQSNLPKGELCRPAVLDIGLATVEPLYELVLVTEPGSAHLAGPLSGSVPAQKNR